MLGAVGVLAPRLVGCQAGWGRPKLQKLPLASRTQLLLGWGLSLCLGSAHQWLSCFTSGRGAKWWRCCRGPQPGTSHTDCCGRW